MLGSIIMCICFGSLGFLYFPREEMKAKNVTGSIVGFILCGVFWLTGYGYAVYLVTDYIDSNKNPAVVRGVIEDISSTGKSGDRIVEIRDLRLQGKGSLVKHLAEGDTVYIYYYPKSQLIDKVISGENVRSLDEILKSAREDINNNRMGTEGKAYYLRILEQVEGQLDD